MAIEHASGPMQVLAGPGSGKTYLIIRRIRHLIRHHGISPNNILVITFTKAAAQEMKNRFIHLTEGEYPAVCFGTFHAVYFNILNKSGGRKLKLATMKDKKNCLNHILNRMDMEDNDEELTGKLLKAISNEKNNKGSLKTELQISGLDFIYKEYCRIMQEENKIDFDDMILLCDKLLDERQDVLSYWQNQFSHILVDEFQDISPLQYKVLCRLALPHNHLFVVGDDDQSIYGFRGAGPDIMRRFREDYPEALQTALGINYRCSGAIVAIAEMIIKDNKNRFPKLLTADREEGEAVKILSFDTREEEHSYLIGALLTKTAQELAETAIIYRTNADAAAFSRLLAVNRIPFRIHERFPDLFETQEAQDILACLTFASDYCRNPAAGGRRRDFLRFMNKPQRYIGRASLADTVTEEGLLRYYNGKSYMGDKIRGLFADIRRIAGLRPYLAVDYIRKRMNYEAYLYEGKNREDCCKIKDILDTLQKTARDYRTLSEWKEYIKEYGERMTVNNGAQRKDGVSLLTMHGSKGLEYKNVYLADINEGKVPNKKAALGGQIEEERRLFYVAVTRAKECLEILHYGKPSVFLEALKKAENQPFSPNSYRESPRVLFP